MTAVPNAKNGYLYIPDGAPIHTIPEPGQASGFAGSVKRRFTSWSDSTSVGLFLKDTMDVSDAHQGAIGDCWFLAGAAAILSREWGSQVLKNTMIDEGNGWCIVRLYDGDLRPVFIRTRKTRSSFLGIKSGVTGITKTGFWPVALEKAAACFTGADRRTVDVNNPSLAHTESGHSTEAFRMLLGCAVTMRTLQNLEEGGSPEPESRFGALMTANWNFEVPAGGPEALRTILGDQVTQEHWKRYRALVSKGISTAKNTNNPDRIAIGAPVPAEVRNAIVAYIKLHGLWSRSEYRGSGKYSQRMETLFADIQNALAGRSPVAFGTKENIGRRERGGHSANESIVQGMVGRHAYAILRTFEENVLARRKFVKVSNPWGKVGRAYTDSAGGTAGAPELAPAEQKGGVFWLELADFCRMIQQLYVGSPIADPGPALVTRPRSGAVDRGRCR